MSTKRVRERKRALDARDPEYFKTPHEAKKITVRTRRTKLLKSTSTPGGTTTETRRTSYGFVFDQVAEDPSTERKDDLVATNGEFLTPLMVHSTGTGHSSAEKKQWPTIRVTRKHQKRRAPPPEIENIPETRRGRGRPRKVPKSCQIPKKKKSPKKKKRVHDKPSKAEVELPKPKKKKPKIVLSPKRAQIPEFPAVNFQLRESHSISDQLDKLNDQFAEEQIAAAEKTYGSEGEIRDLVMNCLRTVIDQCRQPMKDLCKQLQTESQQAISRKIEIYREIERRSIEEANKWRDIKKTLLSEQSSSQSSSQLAEAVPNSNIEWLEANIPQSWRDSFDEQFIKDIPSRIEADIYAARVKANEHRKHIIEAERAIEAARVLRDEIAGKLISSLKPARVSLDSQELILGLHPPPTPIQSIDLMSVSDSDTSFSTPSSHFPPPSSTSRRSTVADGAASFTRISKPLPSSSSLSDS